MIAIQIGQNEAKRCYVNLGQRREWQDATKEGTKFAHSTAELDLHRGSANRDYHSEFAGYVKSWRAGCPPPKASFYLVSTS
jgi:hypothetical protein